MIRTIRELLPRGKRVVVRVDYNLPGEGKELNASRILASLHTLNFLARSGAQEINLLTHFGRPEGEEDKYRLLEIAKLLLKILQDKKLSYLSNKKKHPQIKVWENQSAHSPVLQKVYQIPPNFNLYENLRFDPGEKANDPDFAKELAQLGDCFVNDAFSACHRAHASVVGLAKLLPSYAGFQVLKELKELGELKNNPKRPFVAIIGGAKIEDKLPVIQGLKKIADNILVGGKVAGNLLLGSEKPDEQIILPRDGVNEKGAIIAFEKAIITKEPAFDIGSQTINLFKNFLKDAQTVFWNGNLGQSENRKFVHGTNEIARFLAYKSRALKVLSGGDTTAAVDKLGLISDFDFASTGGGATSAYLAGHKLPGIQVLEIKKPELNL